MRIFEKGLASINELRIASEVVREFSWRVHMIAWCSELLRAFDSTARFLPFYRVSSLDCVWLTGVSHAVRCVL